MYLNLAFLLCSMYLSIVIPAYNEEKRIQRTLEKILHYCKKHTYSYEILVVNDSSTDKTKEVAQDIGNKHIRIIENAQNRGKGYSVKQGFLHACGEWILFTDADLSTPIDELELFFRYTIDYPVVIGSRNLPMSRIVVKQPFLRSTLGKIFPFFVRCFLLPEITDSQCGFKLFRQDVAKRIAEKQRLDGFCFDTEQLFLAKKFEYTIKEVPISWANDERSKVCLFSDPLKMFLDVFRIRWNNFKGKYN